MLIKLEHANHNGMWERNRSKKGEKQRDKI